MKRKMLAALCALMLCISLLPSAAALSGEERRAADTLLALGILQTPPARNRLTEAATRGQAAAVTAALSGSAVQNAEWDDTAVTANEVFAMLLQLTGYSAENGDFTTDDAARFARRIGLATQDYPEAITLGQLCCAAADALSFRCRDSEDTVLSRLLTSGAVTYAQAAGLGLLNCELTARQIYDRCSAAVFQLDLWRSPTEEDLTGENENKPHSTASGFFLDAGGIAVTNFHSIEYAIRAVATVVTGEQYTVEEVLYVNKKTDVAVIRVSRTSLEGKTTSAFAHLELPEDDDVRAGDAAYAIGCPLGAGMAISDGIISDPRRDVKSYELPCILSTASISQGSSGGVLLNVYGEPIGITSGAYLNGNEMYLAVPLTAALQAELKPIRTPLDVFFTDMPFLDLDK